MEVYKIFQGKKKREIESDKNTCFDIAVNSMSEELFLKAVGLFLIGLVRFSGFFINIPVFRESYVPLHIKAGLSALCSALVLPHLLKTQSLPQLSVFGYGIMVLKEISIGLLLGYITLLYFDIFRFGGEVIGMQIGFSFVQTIDPESNRNMAIIGEILQLISVLIFLMLNGHLLILLALAKSFDIVPVVALKARPIFVAELVRISSGIFLLGLQIALPIIAMVLVSDVALGLVARTVPRLNIFQVGFAIKVIIGVLGIMLCIPYTADIVKILIQKVFSDISLLVNKLSS